MPRIIADNSEKTRKEFRLNPFFFQSQLKNTGSSSKELSEDLPSQRGEEISKGRQPFVVINVVKKTQQ